MTSSGNTKHIVQEHDQKEAALGMSPVLILKGVWQESKDGQVTALRAEDGLPVPRRVLVHMFCFIKRFGGF